MGCALVLSYTDCTRNKGNKAVTQASLTNMNGRMKRSKIMQGSKIKLGSGLGSSALCFIQPLE